MQVFFFARIVSLVICRDFTCLNKTPQNEHPNIQCTHNTAQECSSQAECTHRLDNIIASSPTPLLYKTVNRSFQMYDFVVRRRNNPSAEYLSREYPPDRWKKLCPCALYPPYKARRADSTSNHDLMFRDSPDVLCFSCLRFEGKWTAQAQKEYDTYYAPLYTLGEKEEIFRLWKMQAAFFNEPAFFDPWFKESVEPWMNESLTARNKLSDQQIKNLRKREHRKEKQLQLIEHENQAAAPLKKKV
jgi:hypothetical protein